MHIIKLLQDKICGKRVTLIITGTSVKILQGRKILEFLLPTTFQDYIFLNHAEEMAGWLQAVLREEKIRIRRCRIVLDSELVYLQAVKLPAMTADEQKNWVRWEGSQYVPFEQGTYQAALLIWPDSESFGFVPENRVTITADLSEKWRETEESKLQDYLLIAIPSERIEVLQQFSGFLKAQLEEITAMGPRQVILPVNLLPVKLGKEVVLKRGYQAATVLCLLISMFLMVRGGISWQRAKNAWIEADQKLVPFRSVKAAYEKSKETDYRIRQYQQTLRDISRTEPEWSAAFKTIEKTIPEGCWLDALQLKQTKSGQLEIKGCALKLDQITEFLDNLEQSAVFTKVQLVESGTKRIVLKDKGDNSKKVISFLLLAELAPVRKEWMP